MNLIARFSPRRFVVVAAVALIAGCAVGPNFHRPPAPKVSRYTPEPLSPKTTSAKVAGGEAQRFVQGLDIPGQWWKLFHSKPLSALIEQSLKANPDLQAAQSALRVAKENVLAQQGAFYPSISASFTPSRNKTATESLSPASASGNPYYSLNTTLVSVSYTPDVFGLNRRTVESLEAQADVQRFQLEATYLTLTSNLVTAAVQEASLRGQIAAIEEVIRIDKDELDVMRRQNELGQIAMADVVAQEAALAQAQETLPPLQKQLAQQRNSLAALVGSPPSEQPAQRFELGSLRLPQALPVSLPAKLIEERPDVRSAEANLHAASAQIGVAVANRLPNLTLSANGGYAAAQIARLVSHGTGYWTLAATVAAPIFEGGTLLHKQRAAQAAYNQAAAQYRSTVLTALHNVADSLRALQSDADGLKAAVAAERSAAESLDIVRLQLRLGSISYLSLLSAALTYQQARLSLVQAQANRFADTAALFQALGGGWWNRSDVVSAATEAKGRRPPGRPASE